MTAQQIDPIQIIKESRGLAVRIAEECGIARTAVYQWKRVPVHRVKIVARILKLKPGQIRPDIFGR